MKISWIDVREGRTSFRLFSFFLAAALLLFILFVPTGTSLTVRDTTTGQLLWHRQVQEESPFGIRWIHSIHRTPVEEYFRVRGNQVVLVEMSFKEYGIGMESGLAPGERLVNQDGVFRIQHMNRPFPALNIRIGQVRANHTLLFDGAEIPLSTLNRPGSAVTIQAEKLSLWDRIGG